MPLKPALSIAPEPTKLITPTDRLSNWERYAQKSAGGFFTSTAAGETSSWLAALRDVGEHPANFPLVQYHLEVSPDARIFEGDGPGTNSARATRLRVRTATWYPIGRRSRGSGMPCTSRSVGY